MIDLTILMFFPRKDVPMLRCSCSENANIKINVPLLSLVFSMICDFWLELQPSLDCYGQMVQ